MSEGKSFVRMFKPQFAPLVEQGTKLQTVRRATKRMPAPGDKISLRAWTGKPYRSKQRILREAIVRDVDEVRITEGGVRIGICDLVMISLEAFAQNDGFQDWASMRAWFAREHGLPFDGVLIQWGGGGAEQADENGESQSSAGSPSV